MLPGLEILTSGLLLLAGGTVQCTVPNAPRVKVTPITREIAYDFDKSSEELGRMRSSTTNPYGVGVDTATGGLRHDAPKTVLQVKIGYSEYSDGQSCYWYDTVDFQIILQPKIYIAREYKPGNCRQMIMKHEYAHVAVDRTLVNQLAKDVGRDMRAEIDRLGALGPYNIREAEDVQAMMTAQMNKIADKHQKIFERAMQEAQQKVDSLEEYERVSKVCHSEGYNRR